MRLKWHIVQFASTVGIALTSHFGFSQHLLITEVYGGGGNSGAIYKNDFIELFNPTNAAITLSGWSIQYQTATGTSTWQSFNLTGTINAGGFFLIQGSQGSLGTTFLPTPDAVSTLALAATSGKIALVNSTVALSGACPTANIIDLLGYGSANCFEGAVLPAISNTTSAARKAVCMDTNNNANDFKSGLPTPQNSSSLLSSVNFSSGYPKIQSITSSGFQIIVSLMDVATTYFVIVPKDAPAPNSTQIKSGQSSDGVALPSNLTGSITAIAAVTEYSVSVTNLDPNTAYDVYFVNEHCVLSLITKIQTSTLPNADLTPPDNSLSYPKVQAITDAGFQVATNLSEAGKTYFVVLSGGSITPSVNQVKGGLSGNGVPLPAHLFGSITVSGPSIEFTAFVTELAPSTDYSVYFVSEDTNSNLSTSVEQVDIVTMATSLNKENQTITFNALNAKIFGDAPFGIIATSTSGLPVSYSSSDVSIASVNGTTITILKAGTVNIIARQDGNVAYNAANNVVQSLTINRATQAINFSTLPVKTFGDPAFSLSATATSGLPITFGSSDATVAVINGNTITILKAGSVTLSTYQLGNENYNSAVSVTQTLTINKANQSISFSTLPTKTWGDAPIVLVGSSSSGLPVSFSSSDLSIVSISGNMLTILKAGKATITANQLGNENYNPATGVSQTLTINKINQTISFGGLATKVFGDAAFTLTATATSGLPAIFSSSNSTIASVTGSTVTLLKAGKVTITASQTGNENYNSANGVTQTLTIDKANQTILLDALTTKTFGDAPFSLSASATSSLPVNFSSSNSTIASVTGSTVTLLKAGKVTITASQSGNENYNSATGVSQTLTINKANQTILFDALTTKTFGDAAFALTASATSSLPVNFSSSNSTIASVTAGTVTILKAGKVTITASQSGNENYNSANGVAQTLTIDKANQTILFDALTTKTFGDAPFSLSASATSSLPVNFSSSNSTIASVTGGTVTILKAGKVIITASQSGNENYNSANSVTQTLTIDKANQAILFDALTTKTFGDAPFSLSASATSGLPVNFSSSNSTIASVAGSTVTILKAGKVTITASQTGNENYNSANGMTQTLTIDKANQTILFDSVTTKTFGDAPFSLTATSTAGLPVNFSSSDPTMASISGNTLTLLKAGKLSITASQSGNQNYNAANVVEHTLVIDKAVQTITFQALPDKTFGDVAFELSATSSSGLSVIFECSDSTIASIDGSKLTVLKAGIATITAHQSGNVNYSAALSVSQPLNINKAGQRISFNALPDRIVGESFTLVATSTSKLDVTFSTKSTKVSLTDFDVTLVSAGRAILTASQAGNENYQAAISIDRTFCILPAKPGISISSGASNVILTSSSGSGNQWFLNGIAIPGADKNTFTPTTPGMYKVQVRVDDCVSEFSTEAPVVITDVMPVQDAKHSIYPNPAEDRVTFEGLALETTECEIVDMVGRMSRLKLTFQGDSHEATVENFQPGKYVMLVRQQHSVVYFTLLKK